MSIKGQKKTDKGNNHINYIICVKIGISSA